MTGTSPPREQAAARAAFLALPLAERLGLRDLGERCFEGVVPAGYESRVYGGHLLALALLAAARTVPADRQVLSLQADFLRPGDPASLPRVESVAWGSASCSAFSPARRPRCPRLAACKIEKGLSTADQDPRMPLPVMRRSLVRYRQAAPPHLCDLRRLSR